jgi:putative CocE/NonD family hydrolase
MTLISRLAGRIFKLPPAETYAVNHDRDLPVPMPDGAVLLADRYYPAGVDRRPVVLVRSPYGHAGLIFEMVARPLAERGFQVLVQSCRGTFGSGGDFFPFRGERADGLATIAWLRQQPWYPGAFAMFGPSYLSYVQWAVGDQAGPELKALIPIVTTADARSIIYPGETFALDTILSWSQSMVFQEYPPLQALILHYWHARRLAQALMHLPLNQGDRLAAGVTIPFYQDWLTHNPPGDPWWDDMDYRAAVAGVNAPVHLIGGYYDVLFPHTLDCYARLRQAGRNPYLTIGPWTHGAAGMQPVMLNETLRWLRAYLLDDQGGLRQAPVRLYLMGAQVWRDFAAWPPAGYPAQRWHLQAGGGLSPTLPAESEPDRYRYDPADPTPALGGTSLTPNSGPRDNRRLEARRDVLVYTSAALERDLEVIGPLRVELYASSSLGQADFFARLCDVFPNGKSINLSDGIVRLGPEHFRGAEGGVLKVTIELWPTANCFKRGHRVRLQVSSGAHPRFARNPGSGGPLGTARRLIPADQQVFHDPARPSAVILPVKREATPGS